MSIFDRLISTKPGEEGTPAPAAESTERQRRFMGRDGVEAQQAAPVVEKGFDSPAEVWLHVQPATQRLLVVSDLGVGTGPEVTPKQLQDLQRKGVCEAVAYHAGYDQYWKMPAQEAILRAPSLYSIGTPLIHKVKLETRLVKAGEPRGYWMRIRIRSDEELQRAQEEENPTV